MVGTASVGWARVGAFVAAGCVLDHHAVAAAVDLVDHDTTQAGQEGIKARKIAPRSGTTVHMRQGCGTPSSQDLRQSRIA